MINPSKLTLTLSATTLVALVALANKAVSRKLRNFSDAAQLASHCLEFGIRELDRRESVYITRNAGSEEREAEKKYSSAKLTILDSLLVAKSEAERAALLREAKKIVRDAQAKDAPTQSRKMKLTAKTPRKPRAKKVSSALSSDAHSVATPPRPDAN